MTRIGLSLGLTQKSAFGLYSACERAASQFSPPALFGLKEQVRDAAYGSEDEDDWDRTLKIPELKPLRVNLATIGLHAEGVSHEASSLGWS